MAYYDINILLVEDNENDAELAQKALKKYESSISLKRVKDGEEALDFLFGSESYTTSQPAYLPDFILLDLKLPRIDGLEVLKIIRENEQTSFLPVVMLTSSHEDKDMIESYKLGVNSYIIKPVDFDSFRKAMNHVGHYWLELNKQPYKD